MGAGSNDLLNLQDLQDLQDLYADYQIPKNKIDKQYFIIT